MVGRLHFGTLPRLRILGLSVDIINGLHSKEENEEQHLGLHGLSTDATLAQPCVLCQECGAKHIAAVSLQREQRERVSLQEPLCPRSLRLRVLQMTCRLT